MTTNGSVSFFETPLDAAYQASADAQRFATALGNSQPGPEVLGLTLSAISGAIALAVTVANVASAAVGIATLVKDSDNATVLDTLEVEIVNNTTQSIVLYNYVPTRCDVTRVPQPLLPAAADSFVVTSGTVGTFDTGSVLTLNMLVGSSANTVETDLQLSYTGTAWSTTMTIDGEPQPAPAADIQLSGGQFLGASGFPSFSVYTTPIATPSGKITLAFYSTAAS